MSLELDGVCGRDGEPAQRRDEEGGGGEAHGGCERVSEYPYEAYDGWFS